MGRCRASRTLLAGALAGAGVAGLLATSARAATSPPACDHRVLILSAMPLELNPLVAQAKLNPASTVHIDHRTFYAGTLDGVKVDLALTGIGPTNATQTAIAAFAHTQCSFAAALFSGVAGSDQFIGDVTVPRRWTVDGGKTYVGTDPAMYATARMLQGSQVPLSRDVPVGDAACLCGGHHAVTPVRLPRQPQLRVGGDGETSDPFGGHAAPCVFGGGDIAGCEPCIVMGDPAQDTANFSANAPKLVDPRFVAALLTPPAQTTTNFAAQDEETAAVDIVARRYGVPFLGIRAVSDGQGDPLHLPGFPSQFFVYRQLAGNNAAAVTMAFLQAWNRAGRPT